MNSKIFLSIFLAIFAAGVCLYCLFLLHKGAEAKQRAVVNGEKREIGFAAMLKEKHT